MIIGISGLAGTGKDTIADLLVKNHGFAKIALADPLKRICRDVFDFTYDQLWGPSENRNKPDERYQRKHVFESDRAYVCLCCGWDRGRQIRDGRPVPECCLTPRYALQQLGTEWGRNCYDPVWVEYAVRVANELLEDQLYLADLEPGGTSLEVQGEGGHYKYEAKTGIRREILYRGRLGGVAISDVRFTNEMEAISKAGGKLWRVKRTGYESPRWDHPSETQQLLTPDSGFDRVVENDGSLEDLVVKVKNAVSG